MEDDQILHTKPQEATKSEEAISILPDQIYDRFKGFNMIVRNFTTVDPDDG